MAVLWPGKIPRSVLEDPRREAEVRVYNRLGEVLDDSFHVFYSSPWLGTDRLGNEKDGECDFLIAHPQHGILAIEVKGGREISFDPRGGHWRSTDHGGFVHRIRDPVAQARNAKHEILNLLNDSPGWRRRFIHAAHGVIFPGAAQPPGNLGADRPARIFCCSRQFRDGLDAWVAERMKAGQRPANCEPLGRDGIAALERLLAHPFTLSFRISAALADAEAELQTLEPTQYQILDMIADIPRALVQGGAGTGKTVVAIEEAIRSARGGRRTLLTCHSRPLARHLERRLGHVDNLTLAGFHSLCRKMAESYGIRVGRHLTERELFDTGLPNALCAAMTANPSLRWDTVVVDEGQDFHPDWWIAIDSCLKSDGRLRIFMDSNQRVYDRAGCHAREIAPVPVRLTRNLRNTRRIHELAMVHYQGHDIAAGGPEGLEVNWIAAEEPGAQARAALKEMRRLVFSEEVNPGQIAILVNSQSGLERLVELSSGTAVPIGNAGTATEEELVIDTVRRFKGLERPAVIVVVEGNEMERRELAYVAFSRARSYLSVVCSSSERMLLSQRCDQ